MRSLSTLCAAILFGIFGHIPASNAIYILPPAPSISSFTASSYTSASGASDTLSWTTQNASNVYISGVSGSFPTTGSTSVSPSATTTYTLTASNASGTSVTATLTITVPSAITSFTAAQTTIALGASDTLSWATKGAPSQGRNC